MKVGLYDMTAARLACLRAIDERGPLTAPELATATGRHRRWFDGTVRYCPWFDRTEDGRRWKLTQLGRVELHRFRDVPIPPNPRARLKMPYRRRGAPPKSLRKHHTAAQTVMFTQPEREYVRAVAARLGMQTSTWARMVLLKAAEAADEWAPASLNKPRELR